MRTSKSVLPTACAASPAWPRRCEPMAVSRALRRLLRIRSLEEEQRRLALESAIGELNRLEHALAATAQQDRRGRRLVEVSARSGELPDRLAGPEETGAATRHAAAERKSVV